MRKQVRKDGNYMKLITKMRIIHTIENSPEAEYLKTFFEYIGIMVHDEIVQNEEEIYNHLKLANDNNGVDIVLNFSPEVLSEVRSIPNRFFMYFSTEEKMCVVSVDTKAYGKKIELAPAIPSKKETRIRALEFLIDTIWEYDEKNRTQIQKIKDYYVSKDEDRDLFYVLQAKKQIDNLFWFTKWYTKYYKPIAQKSSDSVQVGNLLQNIELYEYVERMFFELWRMCCLLKNNDNSYARYAKINTDLLLYTLDSSIYETSKSELEKIEFNGLNLQILPHQSIIDSLWDFVKNNLLFESAHVMLSKLAPDFRESTYRYLINKRKNSRFPAYYSSIYCDIGMLFSLREENEKAIPYFRESVKLNPLNIRALHFLASLLFFGEGQAVLPSRYARLPLEMLGISEDWYQVANTPFPSSFQFELWIINYVAYLIQLENDQEYSRRASVTVAYALAFNVDSANLIRVLTDDDGAFAEFIKYNENSEYCWTLYNLSKILAKSVNDPFIKDLIAEKLSRWTDEGELPKQYQKEFIPQE